MKIKAAVVENKNAPFTIRELELTGPEAGEVLVRITDCGICHTDAGAQKSEFPTPYPIVLGHEGAGIVEQTGSGVTHLKTGDRVVLTASTCGHCPACLTANSTSCHQAGPLNYGGTMADGTHRLFLDGKPVNNFFGQSSFATHAVVSERSAIVIKDREIDLGLLAPMGCGFQTGAGTVLKQLRPELGSAIAILGCGGVGLAAVMAARLSPCDTIIVVDINEGRLKLAKELGATHSINGRSEDVRDRINEITGGKGLNYAIDAAGAMPLFKTALSCLAPQGKMIALCVGKIELDLFADLLAPPRSIQGVAQGGVVPQVFIPKLANAYKQGRFPVDKLITFYPFEEINRAFADAASGTVIKPVLRIS